MRKRGQDPLLTMFLADAESIAQPLSPEKESILLDRITHARERFVDQALKWDFTSTDASALKEELRIFLFLADFFERKQRMPELITTCACTNFYITHDAHEDRARKVWDSIGRRLMNRKRDKKRRIGRAHWLSYYMEKLCAYPISDPMREWRRVFREAVEKLVTGNIRWVVKYVKRYKDRGLDYIDLISEGIIGLINAAHDCEPGSRRFLTYATAKIKQQVTRAIDIKARTVRVSVSIGEVIREILQARKLESRELTEDELAEKTGFSEERIKEAMRCYRLGFTRGLDVLYEKPDPSHNDLEAFVNAEHTGAMIRDVMKILDGLSIQERTVIKLRFGIDYPRPYTQKEIAPMLGLTRARIGQIEKTALASLKKILENR